jgi:hypothetical protein
LQSNKRKSIRLGKDLIICLVLIDFSFFKRLFVLLTLSLVLFSHLTNCLEVKNVQNVDEDKDPLEEEHAIEEEQEQDTQEGETETEFVESFDEKRAKEAQEAPESTLKAIEKVFKDLDGKFTDMQSKPLNFKTHSVSSKSIFSLFNSNQKA